jgi:hypothetical protein
MTSSVTVQPDSVMATVNYAGKIVGRGRQPAVPSLGESNLKFVGHTVEIHNARKTRDEFDLDVQGFQLVDHRSAYAQSRDRGLLDEHYHDEMAELLRRVTGAREVLPDRTGLVLRLPEEAGTGGYHAPVTWAHTDYTEYSSGQFRDILFGSRTPPLAPYRRWGIYQAWRVTSPPPQDTLLAVTDGRTVANGNWVVFDGMREPVDEPGNVWEARLCKVDAGLRWCYFADMTPDEVLIFKGYDSRKSTHRDVFHTAFKVPYPEGTVTVARSSVEARYFAFWD